MRSIIEAELSARRCSLLIDVIATSFTMSGSRASRRVLDAEENCLRSTGERCRPTSWRISVGSSSIAHELVAGTR